MPSIDIAILKTLLAARPGYVSGNEIAASLGISRVGIWARLEKLRGQGFQFAGVRNRGYRLVAEPKELHERLLQAYLENADITVGIHCHPSLDSTNSEAERLLAAGVATPFVVLATSQTAGRGRLGRVWHSPPEGNLYVSFGFRPDLPPPQMQAITLWLGLVISTFLRDEYAVPVGIKWPNDLVLNGRKLAGMLTEARVDHDRMRNLVFGVGLNLNGDPARWPEELSKSSISLRQATGNLLPVNQIAARFITEIVRGYTRFLEGSHAMEMKQRWPEFDILQGRKVLATEPMGNGHTKGVAVGIDDDGSLLLRQPNGATIPVRAGEVTLRTQSGKGGQ